MTKIFLKAAPGILFITAWILFLAGPAFADCGQGNWLCQVREAGERLAEARDSECGTCIRELSEEAFGFLNQAFPVGREVSVPKGCFLEKAENLEKNALVLRCPEEDPATDLVFVFHTPEHHLAGIQEADYTSSIVAALYEKAPDGSRFFGNLKIAAFPWGDGPSFMLQPQSGRVLVHCTVMGLETAPGGE